MRWHDIVGMSDVYGNLFDPILMH